LPRRRTPALSSALDRYFHVNADWADSTRANVRSLLNVFVRDMGPQRQVDMLDRIEVEDWLLAVAERQQASSFNKVRSRLIALLNWTIDMGRLDANPAASIKRRMTLSKVRLRLSRRSCSSSQTARRTHVTRH
jgi:hypothetical protein